MYDHILTISNFHFLLIHLFPYHLRNLSKGVKIFIASHPTQGNQPQILSDLEKLTTSRIGLASKKTLKFVEPTVGGWTNQPNWKNIIVCQIWIISPSI